MIGYGMPYANMAGNYIQELQNMRDRIDSQMQQVQQQQQNMAQIPMQQPTNLTQNFQLAPNTGINNFKIVNNIDDVEKEIVLADTYFVSKNNTQMWIKNSKGDIRIFDVQEIVPKDEKDILIENLQKQIEKLKGGNLNESNESNGKQLSNESIGEQFEEDESFNVPIIPERKTTKRKP